MEHRDDLACVPARNVPKALGPYAAKTFDSSQSRLILLQPNSFAQRALARFLARSYRVVHAHESVERAEHELARAEEDQTDLVVAERLVGGVSGSSVAADWRRRYPQLRRIVLATACETWPDTASSFDAVFQKPFNVHDLENFLTSSFADSGENPNQTEAT